MSAPNDERLLFIGSYTSGASKGIYLSGFDASTGALKPPALAAAAPNPTFLAVHPTNRFLYAVSEVRDSGGRHDSAVNAFAIEPRTGQLTLLNRRPSLGDGPCHVSVDHTGRFLLAANYASGSAVMMPIETDGCLGDASDKAQHHGSGADTKRQEGPHAHSVTLSPDNRFALVADLGLDRVMVYRLQPLDGRLRPNDPPWANVAPGSGPRHMAFHPSLPVAYLVTELGNTVVTFDWQAAAGVLRQTQTVSTLPPGFSGESFAADIHVAPSGRFLYASNRGHDSIAVFAIDPCDGLLTPIAHEPALGRWPRNFALAPDGQWLLAASQHDDTITVFRIDPTSGRLSPFGHPISVPNPVCLKLLPHP